jgi:hypothetical protein
MASEGSVGDRIDFDVLLANQLITSHEDENVIESNPGATSNMPQGTTNQIVSGSGGSAENINGSS